MTYVLGLTGSVGMGKSTTAKMFRDRGIPVWDADQAVHDLYEADPKTIAAIGSLCPAATASGKVDRAILRTEIMADASLLKKIEAEIHPLIALNRAEFLTKNAATPLVVLDIPILYEMGLAEACNGILVVTAPPEVQKARVLARPGMTSEAFETILSKQIPDAEKRDRADFVLDTISLEHAARFVDDLIEQLTGQTHA